MQIPEDAGASNTPSNFNSDMPQECVEICREAMRFNDELARIVDEQRYFKVGGFTWRTFEKDRVLKAAYLKKRIMECEECKSGLARGSVEVPFMGKVLTSDSPIDEFLELELLDSPIQIDISDYDKSTAEEPRSKGCFGSVVFLGGFIFLFLLLL